MEKQIIEKHDELLIAYKNTISKKRFPEYSIYENPEINYSEYIQTKIEEYKKDISEGLNEVIEIPIASNNRFESIVNRAFSKLPPFEGKDKKSSDWKGYDCSLFPPNCNEDLSAHSGNSPELDRKNRCCHDQWK